MAVARTIGEMYRQVNPDEAVPPDDPRYVDLSSGRGGENFAKQIVRRLRFVPQYPYHCHLITGHRGSGKSTELLRLKAELERAKFLVTYVDVEETLDLADVEYLDLLLGILRGLESLARQHNLPVRQELIQDVEDWFSETILTEEQREETERRVGAEAGLGVEVPFLAKLLAYVTGQIRSGSSTRVEVRQRMERRLSDFIQRASLLVKDITGHAQNRGYIGVVAIVDSLEKVPLRVLEGGTTNHAVLFVEHAEQLKALPCHLVYTVPVSLVNDRNLGLAYTDIDMLPMVKIVSPEGDPYPEGIELMTEVVRRRLSIADTFESEELVRELVMLSGGAVRDLLRLVLFAADYTPEDGRIDREAVKRAKNKLIREYERLIHQEDLPLLEEVDQNPYLAGSDLLGRLLYNRLVLPYVNGENWLRVHPAVLVSSIWTQRQSRKSHD